MILPASPPRYPSGWAGIKQMVLPITLGEEGWRVYALQRGIRARPKPDRLAEFTIGLKRAVKRWQTNHDLYVDGIVGPATQLSILLLAAKAADERAGLPGGTSYGFVTYEGGGLLAATNWDSPGGVDVGPAQYRVVGPPFDKERLLFAFDPWQSLQEAARGLSTRQKAYLKSRPQLGARGALEAAALYHNWPSGAGQVVQYGHVLKPDEIADWTVKETDAHGNVTARYTRGEWSREYPRRVLSYSLGG